MNRVVVLKERTWRTRLWSCSCFSCCHRGAWKHSQLRETQAKIVPGLSVRWTSERHLRGKYICRGQQESQTNQLVQKGLRVLLKGKILSPNPLSSSSLDLLTLISAAFHTKRRLLNSKLQIQTGWIWTFNDSITQIQDQGSFPGSWICSRRVQHFFLVISCLKLIQVQRLSLNVTSIYRNNK